MEFKFRAKPKNEITDDSFLHESEFYKDGFYEGFLIQDRIYAYLVNGVAECQEDYIAIEEWCVIDPKTIEPLFSTCTANERKFLDGGAKLSFLRSLYKRAKNNQGLDYKYSKALDDLEMYKRIAKEYKDRVIPKGVGQ